MTLHELKRRLDRFDMVQTVSECVDETSDTMVDLNREQLLHGLDNEGNYLSPKYSEDPYFKSPESAKRYAEWKARIEPKRDKPFDVPNLFITGRYHASIDAHVGPETFDITSSDPNAGSIERKFKKVYGLSAEYKSIYIDDHLFGRLKNKVTQRLGFKFG